MEVNRTCARKASVHPESHLCTYSRFSRNKKYRKSPLSHLPRKTVSRYRPRSQARNRGVDTNMRSLEHFDLPSTRFTRRKLTRGGSNTHTSKVIIPAKWPPEMLAAPIRQHTVAEQYPHHSSLVKPTMTLQGPRKAYDLLLILVNTTTTSPLSTTPHS